MRRGNTKNEQNRRWALRWIGQAQIAKQAARIRKRLTNGRCGAHCPQQAEEGATSRTQPQKTNGPRKRTTTAAAIAKSYANLIAVRGRVAPLGLAVQPVALAGFRCAHGHKMRLATRAASMTTREARAMVQNGSDKTRMEQNKSPLLHLLRSTLSTDFMRSVCMRMCALIAAQNTTTSATR